MAGGKLSPRQKMINMMYLVLTALLAMNVSKEILNAFVTVNNSIEKSNTVISGKNNVTYEAFAAAEKDPTTAAKAKDWKVRAEKIKAISAEVNDFIEKQKTELKKASDLHMEDGKEVFSVDNLDAATRIMIEQKGGDVIYEKMLKVREELLKVIDPKDFANNPTLQATIKKDMEGFNKSLPIDMTVPESKESGHKAEQNGKGWSESNFHMTPTIAGLTILSKLQSDVKSSESQLIDYCFSQIGQVKIVYDKFQAIASANTNYCMPGDDIEIVAGVGAFSEAAKPTITVGGSVVPIVDGQAIYKTQASGSGDRTVPVDISFVQPDGTVAKVHKDIKYTIGTPSGAAVMFDKMNVLYIGVPNPITISSGTGAEKTNASLSTGGSLSKGSAPGKYVANVTTPTNDAKIIVTADGKSTQYPVRIKRIPDPVPTLGGKIKGGSKINKATLQAQGGLVALLENFDFDARFNIMSFTFMLAQKGGDVSPKNIDGPVLNDAVKSSISRAKPGDLVIFDNIKAKGPDGTVRNLGSMTLTII